MLRGGTNRSLKVEMVEVEAWEGGSMSINGVLVPRACYTPQLQDLSIRRMRRSQWDLFTTTLSELGAILTEWLDEKL